MSLSFIIVLLMGKKYIEIELSGEVKLSGGRLRKLLFLFLGELTPNLPEV